LTKVRILLTRNLDSDVQAALQTLDALQALAERTFNTRYKIEILALRAAALDALGNAGEAESTLQEAVELARRGGFIRVFVDQGWHVQHLLSRLARRGVAPTTVRRVLAAFPDQRFTIVIENKQTELARRPFQPQDSAPIAEPLTARELEILALLREPLSAKEIAHNVGISPLTVKRHTVNIYGKLGVNSRWDAVARAIALGILSPR